MFGHAVTEALAVSAYAGTTPTCYIDYDGDFVVLVTLKVEQNDDKGFH